jgi:predicted permease
MGILLQDLRYGLRQLLNSPGFTAAAVLSLALGIGANTALFTLVDAVLLKALPVKSPEELVLFKTRSEQLMAISHNGTLNRDPETGLRVGSSFSYPVFQDFQAQTQTLSDVFAFAPKGELNVNVDGETEIAGGQLVTGGFYSGLGVQPVVGRTIGQDDDQAEADAVAVISHRYWQRRFGLDQSVLGKTIIVNRVPVTIIGITPPQFYGSLEVGDSPDISLPMALEPRFRQNPSEMHEAWYWWVRLMGRMKPGISADQVRAELEGVFQQNALAGWNGAPASRRGPDSGPRALPDLLVLSGKHGEIYLRDSYQQPLKILMIVVGLVLLIACANIANLLLARAAKRRQEMAIRLAIGARRFRLIRQLLTESMLLALMGGGLGWLLAWSLKDILLTWSPGRGSALNADLKLDWRVFCFTASVALFTGILFGLAPALRATRIDLNSALKENSRGSRGSLSLLGKSLVIMQVAAALLLLVGAGLFVRTLRNLESVELGFNADNLLYFRVDPRAKGYTSEQIGPLCQQLIERIEALPGARSTTLCEFTPLSGAGRNGPAHPQGIQVPEADRIVFQQRVRWNYLETMEIPLLAGRGLTPQDDQRSPRVAVINQTMARRLFGDDNPVGKRFGFRAENSGDIEVVGLARDSRYQRPRQDVPSIAYLPYPQNPLGTTTFAVRTAGDPGLMTAAIRQAVRDVDNDLPVFDVKSQVEQVERSLAQERFFPKLTGFFGLLALALAAVGLYGVMSYSVAQRTHEIAIRMALGATEQSILRRVTGQGMLLAIIGVGIGTAASLGLTRFLASFLFGVAPTDPATLVTISLVLIAVALGACLVPARRATRVDPMVALRYE